MHTKTLKTADHETKFPFYPYQAVHGIVKVRNEFF